MINVAIIGCGNMAEWHAEELDWLLDVEVNALYESADYHRAVKIEPVPVDIDI